MIYVSIVIAINANDFPTEKAIYQRWHAELILWQQKNDPSLTEKPPREIAKMYSDSSLKESIYKITEIYQKQNVFHEFDFEPITRKYKAQLQDLDNEQYLIVESAFLFSLLPIIFTYVLGWLIG